MARAEVKSNAGTSSNPNSPLSLTFSFAPKFVVVSTSSSYYTRVVPMSLLSTSSYSTFTFGTSYPWSCAYFKKSSDGKTLYYYCYESQGPGDGSTYYFGAAG